MNCDLVQTRLLESDSPGKPSAELRRHLAECPSCRVWQHRLVQVEEQLPLLSSPPSSRKAEVVRLILEATVRNGAASAYVRPSPFTTPPRERGLRKVAAALALVAALAIFALGWGLWPHHPSVPAPVDSLAAHRLERDRRLRDAPTAKARVETLAALANSARQEAVELAPSRDAIPLEQLAKFYVELVRDDLLKEARNLPPEQRPDVLVPLAAQLQAMESELQGLSASDVKPANKAALREMALAAQMSHDRLLKQ